MKRRSVIVGALGCLALAAVLFVAAADVSRWRTALPADDVRYRMSPGVSDLWRPREVVPLGAARSVLGIDDDLAFRRALRAVRLAQLDRLHSSDPSVALIRNEAQARLQAIVEDDHEPTRRSRAMGLVGVLSFASALSETQDQAPLLQEAVASFREAIALDPENGEAKVNLERALQRGRGLQATAASGGPNPSPGGGGSRGAGAGSPGSGY